jgi:hypothetical protein
MVVIPDIEGFHSGELVPLLVILVSLYMFPDKLERKAINDGQDFVDNVIFWAECGSCEDRLGC